MFGHNKLGLKVFEKDGKFGVATEEQYVPQYTFASKHEAEEYIKTANQYEQSGESAGPKDVPAGDVPAAGSHPVTHQSSQEKK